MPRINPTRLKHFRGLRRMSLDELADRSKVHKSSLHRIEKGGVTTTRDNNLNKIAKALGVSPEELTSDADPVVQDQRSAPQDKSQVSFRLENRFRNAFALVSQRYPVDPVTIVRLAPLLFVMVAEDSLRRRMKRLSALNAARAAYGPLPMYDSNGEFEQVEKNSILSRDIFGRQLEDGMTQEFFNIDSDFVGQWNPFGAYIKDWFEQAGEAGGISEWDWDGLYYSICPEEALVSACGDESVAMALLDGTVGLHEVPDDLAGNADERLEWLKTKIAAVAAEREERMRAFKSSATARVAELLGEFSKASTPIEGQQHAE